MPRREREREFERWSRGDNSFCSCGFRDIPPLDLIFSSLSLRSLAAAVGCSCLSPSQV
uniref:Uncharacterized protein n=1 Tax=Triticum urartu TaxID=4572 RepID=A0A8R7QQ88_TRIUA